MAFYDKYTGGRKDPRDDWRDDEQTRRPRRDQGQTEGEKKDSRKVIRTPKKGERNGEDARHSDRQQSGSTRRYEEKKPERKAEKKGGKAPERREGSRGTRGGGKDEHGSGTYQRDERHLHDERHGSAGRRVEREDEFAGREQEAENLLVGRNPIREALRTGRDMEKLLVARGELMGSAREIVAMARDHHVVVQEVDRVRLDAMAPNHQGMIAVVSAYEYHTLEDIFARAAEKEEEPFIVMLDGIMDPHNLGAIIRSAECAGAHGVIIPTRRAVGLTPAAVKASAGAVEHIPVVRETNLSRTVEFLKKEGCWVFGASMNGKNYRNADYSGPVVLVIGSEGDGISKLVADHCDDMVSIPMHGQIDSLNASVAAGILLFAIAEKRGGK